MTATTFAADFEVFWRAYPRRVGKFAARKEYDKVRRGGISQEELLDGIAQYVRTKPSYADFCHARTWLAQGRWLDEVPAPTTGRRDAFVPLAPLPPLEDICQHAPTCPDRWSHAQLEKAEALGDPDLLAGIHRLIARKRLVRG